MIAPWIDRLSIYNTVPIYYLLFIHCNMLVIYGTCFL